MDISKINDHGILELRNAIIIQAAQDYLRHYIPNSSNQPVEIMSLENFFRSTRFAMMGLGVSGEWFIKNLRVLKEEKNSRIKKKSQTSADYEEKVNKRIDEIIRKQFKQMKKIWS